MDTISNNSLPITNARPSSLFGSRLNGTRLTRAGSTQSMTGRSSNVPGPQMNMRFSANTIGARSSPGVSDGRTQSNNTAVSDDTVVRVTESDHHQAVDVDDLQRRVSTLEECNKILMTRVADQERQ